MWLARPVKNNNYVVSSGLRGNGTNQTDVCEHVCLCFGVEVVHGYALASNIGIFLVVHNY